MPSALEVVFTKECHVNREQLQDIIDVLNRNEIDEDEDEQPLTIDEVIGNKALLEYICGEALDNTESLYDPVEFWNGDGWCDFKDYR